MVVPLRNVENVVFNVFVRSKPRLAGAFCRHRYRCPLALSVGIERQTDVLADGASVQRFHRSRMRRQVAIEKIAEWTLADEANAGGVFFRGIGQAELMRDIARGFSAFRPAETGFWTTALDSDDAESSSGLCSRPSL